MPRRLASRSSAAGLETSRSCALSASRSFFSWPSCASLDFEPCHAWNRLTSGFRYEISTTKRTRTSAIRPSLSQRIRLGALLRRTRLGPRAAYALLLIPVDSPSGAPFLALATPAAVADTQALQRELIGEKEKARWERSIRAVRGRRRTARRPSSRPPGRSS